MRSREELLNLGLPKWPQMYTTGVPVDLAQAKEIIRRTDVFFQYGGGNNHEWNSWARAQLKMWPDQWRDPGYDEYMKRPVANIIAEQAAWKKRWGFIDTNYVHNSWMSSAFISGPHGWCHPDGTIGFIDNVGKWPSIGDIVADWEILAKAFDFLDIGVTLMDGESCEDAITKVVSLHIWKGSVEVIDPLHVDVHAGHAVATRSESCPDASHEEAFWQARFAGTSGSRFEQGLPDEWITEWSKLLTP